MFVFSTFEWSLLLVASRGVLPAARQDRLRQATYAILQRFTRLCHEMRRAHGVDITPSQNIQYELWKLVHAIRRHFNTFRGYSPLGNFMSTSLNVLIRGLKQIEGNMISRTFPGIQKLHVKHMSKPSKITSSTVVQLNEDQQPYSV